MEDGIFKEMVSQYGSAAFSLDEIQEIARSTGLTIPDRPRMTFENATKKGKNLFTKTYNVPKGTKQKPEGESE